MRSILALSLSLIVITNPLTAATLPRRAATPAVCHALLAGPTGDVGVDDVAAARAIRPGARGFAVHPTEAVTQTRRFVGSDAIRAEQRRLVASATELNGEIRRRLGWRYSWVRNRLGPAVGLGAAVATLATAGAAILFASPLHATLAAPPLAVTELPSLFLSTALTVTYIFAAAERASWLTDQFVLPSWRLRRHLRAITRALDHPERARVLTSEVYAVLPRPVVESLMTSRPPTEAELEAMTMASRVLTDDGPVVPPREVLAHADAEERKTYEDFGSLDGRFLPKALRAEVTVHSLFYRDAHGEPVWVVKTSIK